MSSLSNLSLYKAPKPDYPHSNRALAIFLRIIFPIILLWDLISYLVNKAVANSDRLLNQYLPSRMKKEVDHSALSELTSAQVSSHIVKTHDGAELETLDIKPKDKDLDKEAPCIINFLGNDSLFSDLEEVESLKEQVDDQSMRVVAFHYRDVGGSKGKIKCADDFVIDGIAQVQRLLDEGVQPNKITLKGHSFGGAIASKVAAHFHRLGKTIKVFNDRSFSTGTNRYVSSYRYKSIEGSYPIKTTGNKFIAMLMYPFIKLFLVLSQFEINAGKAFKSVPEAYRDYIVIRPLKIERSRMFDPYMPHYASIHRMLNAGSGRHKEACQHEFVPNLNEFPSKLYTKYYPHSTPLRYLESSKTGEKQTALAYFKDFVAK